MDAPEAIALASVTNNFVVNAIKKIPNHFCAFAALPTAAQDKAAQELERRVKGQKFAGVVFNRHNRGRFLDDKFSSPILEYAKSHRSIYTR